MRWAGGEGSGRPMTGCCLAFGVLHWTIRCMHGATVGGDCGHALGRACWPRQAAYHAVPRRVAQGHSSDPMAGARTWPVG
jgi:hypothetical protein